MTDSPKESVSEALPGHPVIGKNIDSLTISDWLLIAGKVAVLIPDAKGRETARAHAAAVSAATNTPIDPVLLRDYSDTIIQVSNNEKEAESWVDDWMEKHRDDVGNILPETFSVPLPGSIRLDQQNG